MKVHWIADPGRRISHYYVLQETATVSLYTVGGTIPAQLTRNWNDKGFDVLLNFKPTEELRASWNAELLLWTKRHAAKTKPTKLDASESDDDSMDEDDGYSRICKVGKMVCGMYKLEDTEKPFLYVGKVTATQPADATFTMRWFGPVQPVEPWHRKCVESAWVPATKYTSIERYSSTITFFDALVKRGKKKCLPSATVDAIIAQNIDWWQ